MNSFSLCTRIFETGRLIVRLLPRCKHIKIVYSRAVETTCENDKLINFDMLRSHVSPEAIPHFR